MVIRCGQTVVNNLHHQLKILYCTMSAIYQCGIQAYSYKLFCDKLLQERTKLWLGNIDFENPCNVHEIVIMIQYNVHKIVMIFNYECCDVMS